MHQDVFTAHHSNPKTQHRCPAAQSSSAGFYKQNSWRSTSPTDFGNISTATDRQLFPNSSTTALSFHSKTESLQSWMHSPPRARVTRPHLPATNSITPRAAVAEHLLLLLNYCNARTARASERSAEHGQAQAQRQRDGSTAAQTIFRAA